MAYTTYAEMKKLIPVTILVSLSNDTEGAVSPNMTVIAEVIDQADKEIDSYIGMVVSLPLTTTPALIQNLSTKMAIWNLHLRKYFDSKVWSDTYNHCLYLLRRIAEGKLQIDSTLDSMTSDAEMTSPARQFTDNVWALYR